MSLVSKLTRFASSSQGKKLVRKAKSYADSPKGRQKIDQVAHAVQNVAGKGSRKDAGREGDSSPAPR